MTLYPPFFISARLAPALRVGDATLSLLDVKLNQRGGCDVPRALATFALDFPDGTSFEDANLRSGCGGFQSIVEIFETFLSFLEAAVESYNFEQRNPGETGENTRLFPRRIVKWAANQPYLKDARCDLCDEDGNVRAELIVD